ncbi:HD family phosphohydrolase [Lysinibacillus sp. KU-BSD001]|uniref:HD family phosphohydrolase n=1 Tax=Lysinibacillus sp. KU-BSD001 TaxID=3141328 RepID=UPI0036DFAF54
MEKHLKRFIDLMGFRSFLVAVVIVTGTIQFTLMLDNVRGVTYDISMGSLAPETIRASKTVEDTEKTEQERINAENAVTPIYDFNQGIAEQKSTLITLFFDLTIEARNEIAKEDDLTQTEKLDLLKAKLKSVTDNQGGLSLTDNELQALLAASETQVMNTRNKLVKYVGDALAESIRKENLVTARANIEATIRSSSIDNSLLSVAITLGRGAIVETEILNEEKTAVARQQARNSVEATKILQGQIIVLEGEIIDREKYRQLELLGFVDSQSSLKPIGGLGIFIVLQMLFMLILFDRSTIPFKEKRNYLLVSVIVYIGTIIMMKLVSIVSDNFDVVVAFIFPTALATMLVRLLANERVASIVTILIASSAGIMFQESYAAILQMDIALYVLFGGFASLFFMHSVEKRSHILQASTVIMAVNLVFIAFYLLMTQSDYGLSEIAFYIGAGVVSGLLSGALTIGLLPFFESMFGILSTMRLIELSNPNHPLLKKILTETPGTYHHSVMVANLAEAACEAIGADGLLARVGCYYHDVGKTRRPAFFIENQMGINPHDTLPPDASADIIIAHTTDGAELLRNHKMPQEIIDIALQHHGTSLLKFFLHKAKEDGKQVNEADFRYPGPKPQTKEIAVISIADSVEAAVRSMKEPNAEKIHKLIQSIIQDRVQDNQFDECDISLKELKIIEKVLCETLNGIFHTRIEYPKEKTEEL